MRDKLYYYYRRIRFLSLTSLSKQFFLQFSDHSDTLPSFGWGEGLCYNGRGKGSLPSLFLWYRCVRCIQYLQYRIMQTIVLELSLLPTR